MSETIPTAASRSSISTGGKSVGEHTPGPWRASNGALVRVFPRGSTSPICGVHKRGAFSFGETAGETQANAALIAAAPDMLQKLKKIVAWLTRRAEHSEREAKDTRFITLAEANAADAKSYCATIADLQPVIDDATGVTR